MDIRHILQLDLNLQCVTYVSPFWQLEYLHRHCQHAHDAFGSSILVVALVPTPSLQMLLPSALADQSLLINVKRITDGAAALKSAADPRKKIPCSAMKYREISLQA